MQPNPDNTAVIKSLADAMDQINRKVKAVMLRVDECEKRLDAQQALSRVGGAFKSGGIKSDVSRLMEASEEPVKPDLFDQAANDKTPNLLQHIKSDMRDFIHDHYDTASGSVPVGSVQRDAPAPKSMVRPSHELPTVGFEVEEDVVNVGEARGEEHPELVEPRADSREECLEERSLELACASRRGSISMDSAKSSTPRGARLSFTSSPKTRRRSRQMIPPISVDACSDTTSRTNFSKAHDHDSDMSIGGDGALHMRVMSPDMSSVDSDGVSSLLDTIRHTLTGSTWCTIGMTKMFAEANTTKLKESSWDMCLFMFYPPLGLATNILVLICVTFNCFLQLAFTYMVVIFIATGSRDLDVLANDFVEWHAQASLEERSQVCTGRHVLGTGYGQMTTYAEYQEYTGTGGFAPGAFLAFVACTALMLAVLKVVGDVVDQVKAVLPLSDRKCGLMEIIVDETGFTLERIPVARCCFFIMMCSVQVVVAVTLLVAGVSWLGKTTELVEVLLNGIALAYIMDLDGLTYYVLAPPKLRIIMRLLDPIKVNWPLNIPVRTASLSIPLVVTMVIVGQVVLRPQTEDLLLVQDALCPSGTRA